MPVYEYKCKSCGHSFELLQKISDMPPDSCPECNGKVERQMSKSTFVVSKSGNSHPEIKTRCGKGTTCCGSVTPCETPGCEN